MTYRIGIDPGVTGAIALLSPEGDLDDLLDMPTMIVTGTRQKINSAELGKVFSRWLNLPGLTAIVENVASMPNDGGKQAFSFGKSCGIIEGVLGALQIPITFVTPQVWKRRANIPPKAQKDFSRTIAQQLYPLASLDRKKDVGRADAILIARFGLSDNATAIPRIRVERQQSFLEAV